MQFFSVGTRVFFKEFKTFFAQENMKKRPQKLLIIGPPFFPVLPTGSKVKTIPNLNLCFMKIAHRAIMCND